MKDERTLKFEEILKEEDFVRKLCDMEDPEDVQAAFAEKGVDFTIEEIVEIGNALSSIETEGEISEAELENVAGGVPGLVLFTLAASAAIAVIGVKMTKKHGW